MPLAHRFNATNEPHTCLWCGDKLKPVYERGEQQETVKLVEGPSGEIYENYSYRNVNGPATGRYGWEGNDLFCTLRCGEAFGKQAARNGYRFAPLKGSGK